MRMRTIARASIAATLAAGLLSPAGAVAAQEPAGANGLRKAALDLELERTPAIVGESYEKLPPIGQEGQLGANLKRDTLYLPHQQHGDLFVRAGIVRGDRELIEQGLSAFDYAFAGQSENGSFGPYQPETYAFFVQSVAHSIGLLQGSPYAAEYAGILLDYERRLKRASRHMIEPAAWKAFEKRNKSYTHSGYVMGTALGLTSRLTGSDKLKRRSRDAVRIALDNQRRSGVNPELGGYDVRYQMAGIVYAQRFTVYFPGGGLSSDVVDMIDSGLRWMKPRIDEDGYIDPGNSTRSCVEDNTNGEPKTPGYNFAIRGFAYWGALYDRGKLSERADRMLAYLRSRANDESLCGPKSQSAGKAPAQPAPAPEGPPGQLEDALVEDLFE